MDGGARGRMRRTAASGLACACLVVAVAAGADVRQLERVIERNGCGRLVSGFAHRFRVDARDGAQTWTDLDARPWRADEPVQYRKAGDVLVAEQRLPLQDAALRLRATLDPAAGRFALRYEAQAGERIAVYLARRFPGVELPCEASGSLAERPAAPAADETPVDPVLRYRLLREAASALLHRDLAAAEAAAARAEALGWDSGVAAWMRGRAAGYRADARPTSAERLAGYREAEAHVDRAARRAPDVAEIHLWRAVLRGRILDEQGGVRRLLALLGFGRGPRFVSASLQRAVALEPDYDYLGDSVAADAYYGAAKLYRRVPSGPLVRAIVGVEGDLDRAIALAERAVDLGPGRIDYPIELAAALLCRGAGQTDTADARRARRLLDHALSLPPLNDEERAEQSEARRLLQGDPAAACDAP